MMKGLNVWQSSKGTSKFYNWVCASGYNKFLRIKTNAFSRSFFRCVKKVSCKKTRELRIENSVKINDKFEIYI